MSPQNIEMRMNNEKNSRGGTAVFKAVLPVLDGSRTSSLHRKKLSDIILGTENYFDDSNSPDFKANLNTLYSWLQELY